MNPCQPEEVSCSAAGSGSLDGQEGRFLFSPQFQRNVILWSDGPGRQAFPVGQRGQGATLM